MRVRPFLGVCVGTVVAAGCYVPPLAHQTKDEQIASIEPGRTSRAEAIQILGKPTALDEPSIAVWEGSWSRGTIVCRWAGVAVPLGGRAFRVLLEFDERGLVSDAQIEKADVSPNSAVSDPVSADDLALSTTRLFEATKKLKLFGDESGYARWAISPDGGSAAVYARNGKVWLVDLGRGTTREIADLGIWNVRDLQFSGDGGAVAISVAHVELVPVPGPGPTLLYKGNGDSVWTATLTTAMAFSKAGVLAASGGSKGDIRLWTCARGTDVETVAALSAVVDALAFSPDDRFLASFEREGRLRIWDVATGSEVSAAPHVGPILALAWSPDGSTLAVHGGSHVELWRVEGGSLRGVRDAFLLPFFGASSRPPGAPPSSALLFSPGGKYLAASFGAAVLWDMELGAACVRFVPSRKKGDVLLTCGFAPEEDALIVAKPDGVWRWDLADRGRSSPQ